MPANRAPADVRDLPGGTWFLYDDGKLYVLLDSSPIEYLIFCPADAQLFTIDEFVEDGRSYFVYPVTVRIEVS